MDEVKLANWYAGVDREPVNVCHLYDKTLISALEVRSGAIVWLSDYTLTKTRFAHKEIDFRDYKMLPQIVARGFVVSGNKRRSIEIIYADLAGPRFKFWHVCLKGTRPDEVYVTMFHRGNLKEIRRRYRQATRKSAVLRDHIGTPVRRILFAPA